MFKHLQSEERLMPAASSCEVYKTESDVAKSDSDSAKLSSSVQKNRNTPKKVRKRNNR